MDWREHWIITRRTKRRRFKANSNHCLQRYLYIPACNAFAANPMQHIGLIIGAYVNANIRRTKYHPAALTKRGANSMNSEATVMWWELFKFQRERFVLLADRMGRNVKCRIWQHDWSIATIKGVPLAVSWRMNYDRPCRKHVRRYVKIRRSQ